MTGTEIFGLDPMYMNNFVLLAMAGFFTAIVRAPITGIILLFEMSGSVSQIRTSGGAEIVELSSLAACIFGFYGCALAGFYKRRTCKSNRRI